MRKSSRDKGDISELFCHVFVCGFVPINHGAHCKCIFSVILYTLSNPGIANT